MRGQIEDRLLKERGKKGSGHKEAYVRFRALRAAMRHRNVSFDNATASMVVFMGQ